MIATVAILFFITVAAYLAALPRERWIMNPVPVFVVGQTVMFAGALPLLDSHRSADISHAIVMYVALLGFLAGALGANAIFPVRGVTAWRNQRTEVEESFTFAVTASVILLVSVAVTVAYYRAVGVNIFLDSALSYLRSGQGLDDPAALRRQFYAGDEYFAPGYVNQFKNILLPLCTLYLGFRYRLAGKRRDSVLFWGLLPVTIVALLGTGQRGPLIDVALIAMVYGVAVLPRKTARRFAFTAALLTLTLFGIATLFLNRGVHGEKGNGSLTAVAAETWERVSWGNQAAAVAGFRYVYERPVVWGADWFASAASVIPRSIFPDKPISTLSLEIFEQLFYSRSGTAPASIWGSVWYNFGPFGLIFVPFIIGVLYHHLYGSLVRGRKILARLGVYAGLTIVLGFWEVGGIETLLNRGLLALVLLAFLIRLRFHKRRLSHPNHLRDLSSLRLIRP